MKTNYTKLNRYKLQVIYLTGLFFIACSALLLSEAAAQPTNKINYQAVARSITGNVIPNDTVSIRLSILNGSGGPSLYTETHSAITNQFGLFTLQLGGGSGVSGNYNTIDWNAGDQWLKVEMDPAGGSAYVNMGESQLLSVPYALYAAGSAQWSSNGNDISNNNSGKVGINNNAPASALHVYTQSDGDGFYMQPVTAGHGLGVLLFNTVDLVATLGAAGGGGSWIPTSAANDVILKNSRPNALIFGTNDVERMRIDLNGDVAIGATTPAERLMVSGGSILVDDSPGNRYYQISRGGAYRWTIRESATTGMEFYQIYADGGTLINTVRMEIADYGNIGIGTATPDTNTKVQVIENTASAMLLGTANGVLSYLTVNKPATSNATEIFRARDNGATVAIFNEVADTYQLTLFGDAFASGGTWINSDRNIKRDIGSIDNALDGLMALKPAAYYFDSNNERFRYLNLPEEQQFGLVAQDVKNVFPNIVREAEQYDENGKPRPEQLLSVNYTALIPVLIKGMQEQQKTIEMLKSEVELLKSGGAGKK